MKNWTEYVDESRIESDYTYTFNLIDDLGYMPRSEIVKIVKKDRRANQFIEKLIGAIKPRDVQIRGKHGKLETAKAIGQGGSFFVDATYLKVESKGKQQMKSSDIQTQLYNKIKSYVPSDHW